VSTANQYRRRPRRSARATRLRDVAATRAAAGRRGQHPDRATRAARVDDLDAAMGALRVRGGRAWRADSTSPRCRLRGERRRCGVPARPEARRREEVAARRLRSRRCARVRRDLVNASKSGIALRARGVAGVEVERRLAHAVGRHESRGMCASCRRRSRPLAWPQNTSSRDLGTYTAGPWGSLSSPRTRGSWDLMSRAARDRGDRVRATSAAVAPWPTSLRWMSSRCSADVAIAGPCAARCAGSIAVPCSRPDQPAGPTQTTMISGSTSGHGRRCRGGKGGWQWRNASTASLKAVGPAPRGSTADESQVFRDGSRAGIHHAKHGPRRRRCVWASGCRWCRDPGPTLRRGATYHSFDRAVRRSAP